MAGIDVMAKWAILYRYDLTYYKDNGHMLLSKSMSTDLLSNKTLQYKDTCLSITDIKALINHM